jgi:hypothetical protein
MIARSMSRRTGSRIVSPNFHFSDLLNALNIWVDREGGNAERVFRALAEFGAPL